MSDLHVSREIALEVLNNIDEYNAQDIIHLLEAADELYHNDQESFIEDNEYDALRLIAQRLDPTNKYFLGIGSEVRGGKVKLPYEMGSLDQVEIGDIEEWVRKNKLQNEDIVLTDKMDGTSAMLVYDENGAPQIAYSRGNGTEGADISRHIFKITNVPPQLPCGHKLVVRAEVELTETAFEKLCTKVKSRSGKPYRNARNMVAGLMNSKTNPDVVYDYLTVIAYEVIGFEGSKKEQLEILDDNGFQVVMNSTYMKGKDLTDEKLAKFLEMRRAHTDFAIDGIVIDVNGAEKRNEMNPTRETLNPSYSIKYKVADASNYAEVEVLEVEWNISKHGYIKPRLILTPTDLCGVTVTHTTGYNAKYILDNKIGKGTIIAISRMGDVVPNPLHTVKSTQADLPTEDFEWNETGVDLVLVDHHDNDEVKIQQMIDFFASIDAPHLKEGSVRKFYEVGYHTIEDVIQLTNMEMFSIIGANGNKIYDGLRAKLTDVPHHVIMGSVPFFGRGVGKRKFKKLIRALGWEVVYHAKVEDIVAVDGFEEKTAHKIVNGINDYLAWLEPLEGEYITIKEEVRVAGGSMNDQKVIFTGFRDKVLHEAVEAAGGEMQMSVSGKTTLVVTKNPNSNSGKVKKARDKGIKIISIDDLKELLK